MDQRRAHRGSVLQESRVLGGATAHLPGAMWKTDEAQSQDGESGLWMEVRRRNARQCSKFRKTTADGCGADHRLPTCSKSDRMCAWWACPPSDSVTSSDVTPAKHRHQDLWWHAVWGKRLQWEIPKFTVYNSLHDWIVPLKMFFFPLIQD